MRVLYVAGPGNVIQTYKHWVQGEDDPSQVAITYSGQFYDVCSELNLEGYIISSYPESNQIKDNNLKIEHRPVPFMKSRSGILYHLGQIWYGINLIRSALHFQADFVIVVTGSTHLFLLLPLAKLGIKITPLLQCVLYKKNGYISNFNRFLLKLNGYFMAKGCYKIFSLSKDITDQVYEITGNSPKEIIEYLPIYRREEFSEIEPINHRSSPFQILFAGRIEINKGVFELLEIAKSLIKEGRTNFVFNFCGNGSQLETLRSLVKTEMLSDYVLCWGHCNKNKMKEMFNKCHIVVVPTTTDFIEGFNKVVVEGVLSMRPVITSSICPAINYVREAVIEVSPNDRKGYKEAILSLATDQKLYESKQQACLNLREKFYNYSNGWGEALKSVLPPIKSEE